MTSIDNLVVVSVVSHGHGPLLRVVLQDLAQHCARRALHVEITLNVDEDYSINPEFYPFSVAMHRNAQPKGFGANHNAAFHRVRGGYFCVLNPDVRLTSDPFVLISRLGEGIGIVAPQVLSLTGNIQPTARHLPTPWRIAGRLLGIPPKDYDMASGVVRPDWVGGMFMLFTHAAYKAVNGFDERFFMYYEDVDLCARLRLLGYAVQVDPAVTVIHDGAYASHRNWRHFRWHVTSMARFFLSGTYARARHLKNKLPLPKKA
jgi:hypothetical protein